MTMILAQLSSDSFATAEGLTTHSGSPVISLCRALIAAGHASSTPMEVYRGQTLALIVRTIGKAAQLEVDAGPRFVRASGHRIAPYARPLGSDGSSFGPSPATPPALAVTLSSSLAA